MRFTVPEISERSKAFAGISVIFPKLVMDGIFAYSNACSLIESIPVKLSGPESSAWENVFAPNFVTPVDVKSGFFKNSDDAKSIIFSLEAISNKLPVESVVYFGFEFSPWIIICSSDKQCSKAPSCIVVIDEGIVIDLRLVHA